MRRVVPALALVLLAASARADDRTGSLLVFPGSLSASVGTIGPAEAGNVVTVVRTEQSVALWRIGAALIGGTVVAGASTDLDGYAWNRTQPYTVGAKVMTTPQSVSSTRPPASAACMRLPAAASRRRWS
jgi:hypothetical protein